MTESVMKSSGFLKTVERIGNAMPHPLGIFLGIIGIVLVMSALLSWTGTTVIHPQTKEVIAVQNMLAADQLMTWAANLSKNLQNFPVLALVLIMAAITGICEQVGFFTVAIRHSLRRVPGSVVVFTVALVAIIGHIAGDVAFAIIPALSASLFMGLGRHPLVGLFLGYAAVGGGFGVSVIPGGTDVILTPISVQAAQMIDADFDMNILNGYYILAVSTLLIAAAATFVTIRFVEPRFGTYQGELLAAEETALTDVQLRALRRTYVAVGIFLLLLLAVAWPSNSILRSDTGSLVVNAPLTKLIFPILLAVFLLAGLVFGCSVGRIRSLQDVAALMNDSVKAVSPFVVIAIVVSQFLYIFDESHLGAVLAIKGGEALTHLAVPVAVVIVLFFTLEAVADMFIISGSSRYLIFAPVFVPMMMQIGVHPAMTQAIHRMGGSVSNSITPLNAFFPVLLGLAQKYDRKVGMGTIFSAMIPYTIAYAITYLAIILVWYLLDLPVGVGAAVSYP